MPDLMLQFHHPGGKPSVAEARALFELSAADVDENYGVTATDPANGIYVILVKPEAAQKAQSALAKRQPHSKEGLFGNPRVEPTGPPRP